MSVTETGAEELPRRGSARVLANSSFRALADIGGKLGSALLMVLLARKVGAGDFGIFLFALSLSGLLTTPGAIGQDIVLTREVARDHARLDNYFSDALVSRLLLSGVAGVLGVGGAAIAGLPETTLAVLALLVAGAMLDSLLNLQFAVFQAFERLASVPVILIFQRWLTAGVAGAALFAGGGIVLVAAIYVGGALLALLLGFVVISRTLVRPRLRPTRRGWLRITREALPVGVANVAIYVFFRINITILAAFQPDEDVGQFGAAFRLLESTLFVTWSVNAALLPVMSRLSPTSTPAVGAVFERGLKLVLALTVPVAVGAAVLATPVIVALYGEPFRAGGTALLLLAPTIALYPISSLTSYLLYAQDRQRVVAWTYGVGIAGSVVVNLALIPFLSFEGAAIATTLCELVIAGVLLVLSRPLHGRLAVARIGGGAVLGSAAAALAMGASRDFLPGAIAAGALVYVAVLLLVERLAFPQDFAALGGLLDRVRGRLGLHRRPATQLP